MDQQEWRRIFTLLKLAEMGAHRIPSPKTRRQPTNRKPLPHRTRKQRLDRTYRHTRRLPHKNHPHRNRGTPKTLQRTKIPPGSRLPTHRNFRRHSFHGTRRRRILHRQRYLSQTIRRKTRLRTLPRNTEPKTNHRLRHQNSNRTRSLPSHRSCRIQKRRPHIRLSQMLPSAD
jgi:hypothetical protein